MARLVDVTGFLPRVTVRDGRAIEQALAGHTLFQPGVELAGAVVEASFAYGDPPLLRRLADKGVPRLIDPQTLRFSTDAYLEVEAIAGLPYAPSAPFSAESLRGDAGDELVEGVLRFEDNHGATDYLSPMVPVPDRDLERWVDAHEYVLRAAARANGARDLPRKPLIASLSPGNKAMRDPGLLIRRSQRPSARRRLRSAALALADARQSRQASCVRPLPPGCPADRDSGARRAGGRIRPDPRSAGNRDVRLWTWSGRGVQPRFPQPA